MRVSRRLPVLVLASALLAAGCTSEPEKPTPEAAATALATALTNADLTSIPFDGATGAAATDSLRNAMGALKDNPRTVTVAKVTRKDGDANQATAQLQWTWDITTAGKDWTYPVDVRLALADDKTWHVQWAPTILEPKLTSTERFAVDRTQGRRGDILGADRVVLMGGRDVYRVGIDKSKVSAEQAQASATALAGLMGIDPTAYAKQVAASGAQQFVVAITVRVDDPRIAGKTPAVQAIPGGRAVPDTAVLGPTPTFARALLGTVGQATAEIVKASGGRIGPTDTVGLSGLEQQYDAFLAGTPGLKVRATGKDSAGNDTNRIVFTKEAIAGKPLVTTIDLAAQNQAEAAVAALPVAATLVAIRPSTGEVVAAANNPATNGLQTALTGRFAPGSTFKVVSSLALLRNGIGPDSPLQCEATTTVNGRVFANYSDYPRDKIGTITLREALANSCNTAYIGQQGAVSQDALADAAAALGMGVDFDFGAPSHFGSVPRQATPTEHAASMIGQGKITASALTMATVAASVAKGATVTPRIVERPTEMPASNPAASTAPSTTASTTSPSPSPTTSRAPLPTTLPQPARPLTPEEGQALRSMLGSVVTDGSARVLAEVGATGAKSGTAQYGADDPPRTHAWMITLRGDLAVAVFVADGEGGTRTAGPVMKAFLAAYQG